jgi:hypothetical protein
MDGLKAVPFKFHSYGRRLLKGTGFSPYITSLHGDGFSR